MFAPIIAAAAAVAASSSTSSIAWMLLQLLAVFCLTFAGLAWVAKPKN